MEFSLLEIYLWGALITFTLNWLGMVFGVCSSSPPFGAGIFVIIVLTIVLAVTSALWPLSIVLSDFLQAWKITHKTVMDKF